MWPCTPCTVRCPVIEPRRPIFIMSPKRALLVGSPTTQASKRTPSLASASSIFLVPLMAGPSSSPVISSEIVPLPPCWARYCAAAATKAAMAAFMSAAPRP